MVDDLFELAVELEGFRGEGVVGVAERDGRLGATGQDDGVMRSEADHDALNAIATTRDLDAADAGDPHPARSDERRALGGGLAVGGAGGLGFLGFGGHGGWERSVTGGAAVGAEAGEDDGDLIVVSFGALLGKEYRDSACIWERNRIFYCEIGEDFFAQFF